MKYFKRIRVAESPDHWSLLSPGLLYVTRPQDAAGFGDAVEELNRQSMCQNSGRCCLRAPELTPDERRLLQVEYRDLAFVTGRPCPFREGGACALHGKESGLRKPVQCRSYVCRPHIRNLYEWLGDFCDHHGLEFKSVHQR